MREYLVAKAYNVKHTAQPKGDRLFPSAKDKQVADRTITGIASVFGNTDLHNDVMALNAFDRSISLFRAKRSSCKFLWSHDMATPPVAEILNMRVLTRGDLPKELQTPEVTGALEVTRRYFTNEFSQQVYDAIIGGTNMEMSFGFSVTEYHYEDRDGVKVRYLDQVDLFDVSDVNFGANPRTVAHLKHPYVLNQQKFNEIEWMYQAGRKLEKLKAEAAYRDPLESSRKKLDRIKREHRASFTVEERHQANTLRLNALRLERLRKVANELCK